MSVIRCRRRLVVCVRVAETYVADELLLPAASSWVLAFLWAWTGGSRWDDSVIDPEVGGSINPTHKKKEAEPSSNFVLVLTTCCFAFFGGISCSRKNTHSHFLLLLAALYIPNYFDRNPPTLPHQTTSNNSPSIDARRGLPVPIEPRPRPLGRQHLFVDIYMRDQRDPSISHTPFRGRSDPYLTQHPKPLTSSMGHEKAAPQPMGEVPNAMARPPTSAPLLAGGRLVREKRARREGRPPVVGVCR